MNSQLYRAPYLLGLKKVFSLPGKHHLYILFFWHLRSRADGPNLWPLPLSVYWVTAWTLTYRGDTVSWWWCYYLYPWLIASIKEKQVWDGILRPGIWVGWPEPQGMARGHFLPLWVWCRKFLGGKFVSHGMEFYLGLCGSAVTPPVTSPRLVNPPGHAGWFVLLLRVLGGAFEEEKGVRFMGRNEPKGACANYCTCQCSTTDKINSETQTVCRKPNTII